jgi:MFS family permease
VPRSPRIHYGWVIVATGTLTIFACLGLGRFALGMLLPSMGASLGLSYAQLGLVGTANFVGYLAAVLAAGQVAGRTGSRLLIGAALLLVGASMAAISRVGSFAPLVLLYALTGIGSGAANVPMMGLIARWFHASARGRAAGFATIGSGFAIAISGQLVPWINAREGAGGWRTSWQVLAAAVGAIGLLALALLRNRPEEKGLRAFGTEPPPGAPPPQPPPGPYHRSRAVWLLGFLYAMFGATYSIYVTFLVTSLVRERGFSEGTAGAFWSAIGLLSLLSGPVFGGISDRFGRRAGLALVFSLQLAAYLLAGLPLPRPFLYLSVACFGVVAWSVPAIMTAAVGDQVGPVRTVRALGFLTLFLGLGQVTGPAVAGILAERTGSFSSSFLLAAASAGAAVIACRFLRPPARSRLGE